MRQTNIFLTPLPQLKITLYYKDTKYLNTDK